MTHQIIQLENISLSFKNRLCFDDFSAQILPGSRIGIIGKNGSGKSSLLHMIAETTQPSSGTVSIPGGMSISLVKQTINEYDNLSGGQRFNQALSEALSAYPDVLLLDEPTNHLDRSNKKSLLRMLQYHAGTLIIVSHDRALLNTCVDTLWHLDGSKITVFKGSYDSYCESLLLTQQKTQQQFSELKRQEKQLHQKKMREEQRASKSRQKGEKSINNRKWPTVVSHAKARRSQETAGKKQREIQQSKEVLSSKLSALYQPDMINPNFSLSADSYRGGTIVTIQDGSVDYFSEKPILSHINFSVVGPQKVAIFGDNGSGKSTLLKALLRHSDVNITGDWHMPGNDSIGYVSQHYCNLIANKTVMEHVLSLKEDWTECEARQHLNTFLFRKNEEISKEVAILSGGEKARLSLALIAAKPPRLLILDEMTNNLDLETKEHVEQVLKSYPGAMIVVSHDDIFLSTIGMDVSYSIKSLESGLSTLSLC